MFDFGTNIDTAMSILLGYTGRVAFFGVTVTEMILTVTVLPWAIYAVQSLWKMFSPVPLEFDPVTGSQYDPDWHDERDRQAVDNYVRGVYDPESSGAIRRYREQEGRRKRINRSY